MIEHNNNFRKPATKRRGFQVPSLSYDEYISQLKQVSPKINFDQAYASIFHKRVYYFPKLAIAAALTVLVVFLSLFGVQSYYQAINNRDDVLVSYVFDNSEPASGAVLTDYVFDR
ncbi:MAG: hypothetical protein ABIH69_00070 [bacterium]